MSSLSRFVLGGSALALVLSGCAQPVDAPSDAAQSTANQAVRLQGTPGGEVEFSGAVQSITPPRLVVSGITVVTTPATEIKRGNRKIPLTDLRVGETVKVEGTLEADGSVTAREIEAQPQPTPSPSPTPDDDDDDLEFTGVIQSITPPSLVVSGRTVMTDSHTEFKGQGHIHSILDLRVGDTVEVEGRLMQDGTTVLASEIKRR